LGILKPVPSDAEAIKPVEIVTDPNTGRSRVALTIEEAIARTLANSPEISVVSYDPSIAGQDITRAASEFDVTAFGRLNFEQQDNPPNSIFQPGQSDDRTLESGVKQKGVTGAEWALSYALTRSWDDLFGRTLSTRYEPILAFQLKQPLLRDAGREVTLAGVDIAKLNYEIAMIGFRQKAEDTAAEVIAAYWQLLEARRDAEIQKELLDRTVETLTKVQGRRQIDATDVQIKQAEAFAKSREAVLVQTRKVIIDAQDTLVRLMADSQLNMLDEFEIAPASEALMEARTLERAKLLETAVQTNPVIQQARVAVEIAEINIRVAENQDMPRLDLIASARTQALAKGPENAHDRLGTGDFVSYGVGLSLEYPLGNRQRDAELLKRKLERRKAVSTLQNTADQVALLAKERIRRVETSFSQIQIQRDAVEAARVHLRTLEESEAVRQQLTPEFLLVKLQAQEVLADAERSEIRAIVEFNTSLARLAQALGTVLELHQVKTSMPSGQTPAQTPS
jgi:outer membrane protein TolC